ncbi:hypothetical protein FS842_002938 [Serendipita sp. 407]|nr:hypothetical protein FS842_002938 [Serendipita sp. 407]
MVSAVFLASQRKVIRTIAFRTDQPQFTSIGQNHARKSLRTRHKRSVVVLESLSGRRTELPIEDCTLVDGKAQDRLTINVPGYWPFVVDVQNAELGWPGTTELIDFSNAMAYQYGPPGGPPPNQYRQQQYYPGPPGGGAPGGFQQRHNPAPPPGADPALWQWFSAVDADRSNHISATELQQALVNGDWSPFDLDTVKLLMTLFDTDRSGTIGFQEFSGLWQYIKEWQNVFRHFDRDRSGSIEGEELKAALSQFGYNLNPQLLQLLERKYVMDPPNKASAVPQHGAYGQQRPPGITFDRFVRCCVVVRQLTESFNRLDTQRTGWVQMNYDTFMHTVLSAP